jgi:hypothetical protein
MTVTDPYENGALDPEVHGRLVADLDRYARMAGVPVSAICSPLATSCGEDECKWATGFHKLSGGGISGLAFVGEFEEGIEARMMGLTGCLVRNFIDAKMMTVQDALAQKKAGNGPTARMLAVPNFYVSKEHGGGLASWQVGELLSLLLSRLAEGVQTVVYVSNLDQMAVDYGSLFKQHIENYFVTVSA